uniref:peptidyl-glycine alpha-amidating monooxygenase B-like isoform X1 n=1 Tax=Styela clava TaxID=7725 RepID=UPI001939BBE1|nr:peptidyl-glycine alpha-amidating monooxygenase B-like isoform X1 [Styela clava]
MSSAVTTTLKLILGAIFIFQHTDAYYGYDPRFLNTFSSLRSDLRNKRSGSSIAEQVYYQDLLAPFYNRRQTDSIWKRSKPDPLPTSDCNERSNIQYTSPNTATLDIRFPSVHTTKDDTYLCTAYKVPFQGDESFIVNFIPHADMERSHHMLVFGCHDLSFDRTGKSQCYEPCKNKQTLFAWARNAPQLKMPKDVGYSIGRNSGIRYIAVQMHFAKAFDEGTCSGVTMDITTTPQKYYAGIFLLGAYDIQLPPHSTNVGSSVACENEIENPLHVFAFRTHAHMLANVITGYRLRSGKYKMIGKGNPKWPQSFYPRVGGELELKKGDVLAAQCDYNNTRDESIHAGPSGSDEMCNLYLMFYTSDKKSLKSTLECWGLDYGLTEGDLHFPKDVKDLAPYPGYAGEDSKQAIAEGQAVIPPIPEEHMHSHMHSHDDGEKDEDEFEKKDEFQEIQHSEVRGKEGTMSDAEVNEKLEHLSDLLNETGSESLSRSHGMPEFQGLSADLSFPLLQQGYSIGQVGGLVSDMDGTVHVFHRANRVWGRFSFDSRNRFTEPNKPIMADTIYHLSKDVGKVLHSWGRGQFFMPHGISLDPEGYLWLTDVAMHQVLKYPLGGAEKPILVLGEFMKPGSDASHFCKPTDVAVDDDGFIYVSDGYCNGRVMKFSRDGSFVMQWGRMVTSKDLLHPPIPPYAFFVAHNIILCGPDKSELCVADRENGRIQCFGKTGALTRIIKNEKMGKRVFAIAYSTLEGGVIYGVNGPDQSEGDTAWGFTLHYDTGAFLEGWEPSADSSLTDPHDITASPSGELIYVGDLSHKKVYKFYQVPSAANDVQKDSGIGQGIASLSAIDDKKNEHSNLEETVEKKGKESGMEMEEKPENSLNMNEKELDKEMNENYSDGNVNSSKGATIIIVILVVLPTVSLLIAFACIKVRAKRLKEYESLLSNNGKSSSKLNLGKFLNPTERKGFTRVRSEATDDEDDEDDVEVYSKKIYHPGKPKRPVYF